MKTLRGLKIIRKNTKNKDSNKEISLLESVRCSNYGFVYDSKYIPYQYLK